MRSLASTVLLAWAMACGVGCQTCPEGGAVQGDVCTVDGATCDGDDSQGDATESYTGYGFLCEAATCD